MCVPSLVVRLSVLFLVSLCLPLVYIALLPVFAELHPGLYFMYFCISLHCFGFSPACCFLFSGIQLSRLKLLFSYIHPSVLTSESFLQKHNSISVLFVCPHKCSRQPADTFQEKPGLQLFIFWLTVRKRQILFSSDRGNIEHGWFFITLCMTSPVLYWLTSMNHTPYLQHIMSYTDNVWLRDTYLPMCKTAGS